MNEPLVQWTLLNNVDYLSEALNFVLDVQIEPAPDEWDRLYNVDFFIEIKGGNISS